VLGDDALVLDGHLPAGEGHDAGTEGEVAVVEGGTVHDGSVAKAGEKSTRPSVTGSKETRSPPIAFEIAAIPRTFPTMIHENGNRLLDQLERRFGRLALPRMLHWIIGFQVLCFVLTITNGEFPVWLVHDSNLIFQGQVWRLATWLFLPVSLNPFFFAITVMFMLFVSNSIEGEWGAFRVNVYLVASATGLALAGLAPFFAGYSLAFGEIFFSSAFLAFATLFPNQIIQLFFIIPIKAKWLGVADAIGLVALVLTAASPVLMGGLVLLGLLPYLLTFAPGFLDNYRRESTAKVRRHRFESETATSDTFHECAICGATEKTHPEREFRVAADGNEFCDACRKPL
jgi:hypothetical protein